MYQSPIELIYDDPMDNVTQKIVKETGEVVFQTVLNTGVNVDKDELIKALQYDRNQYDKGYADGRNDATAHADWVGVSPEVDTITCSRCGFAWYSSGLATPYCPECGAHMDNYREMIEIGLPSFEVMKGDNQ